MGRSITPEQRESVLKRFEARKKYHECYPSLRIRPSFPEIAKITGVHYQTILKIAFPETTGKKLANQRKNYRKDLKKNHPEKLKKWSSDWYAKHPEKARKASLDWYYRNREHQIQKQRERRAAKKTI